MINGSEKHVKLNFEMSMVMQVMPLLSMIFMVSKSLCICYSQFTQLIAGETGMCSTISYIYERGMIGTTVS